MWCQFAFLNELGVYVDIRYENEALHLNNPTGRMEYSVYRCLKDVSLQFLT